MTHGGKRAGAGRPPKDISASRVYSLYDSGVNMKEIARRFEAMYPVVRFLNGALGGRKALRSEYF